MEEHMEETEITITDNEIETYMVDFNDTVISIIITDCPNLTTISIDNYSVLTTITIQNCASLNDITIINCVNLTSLSPLPTTLTEFNCDETILDKLCRNPDFLLSFVYLTGKNEFVTDIGYEKQLKLVDKLEMYKDTNNALFEVFMHEGSNPLLARLPDDIKSRILLYLNDKTDTLNAKSISLLNMAVDLVKANSKSKIEAKIEAKIGGKRKTKKRSKKQSNKRSKKRSNKRSKKRSKRSRKRHKK
jgi:hypothetical protein